jgi:glycine/D-amino acid oxidase-like deaminating enzyme
MAPIDTTSYWMDSESLPVYPALDRNLSVDVAVVGGGITGITAAYLLKKAGRTVALLERRRCASVDTGHTTAHLTYVTDTRLSELEHHFGRDDALAVWDAGRAGLWQIGSIVENESIDCDFAWVNAWLHAPLDPSAAADEASLQRDAQLAAELGFGARYLDRVPFVNRPGIEFEGQALFHPRKYLRALLETLPETAAMCSSIRTPTKSPRSRSRRGTAAR